MLFMKIIIQLISIGRIGANSIMRTDFTENSLWSWLWSPEMNGWKIY